MTQEWYYSHKKDKKLNKVSCPIGGVPGEWYDWDGKTCPQCKRTLIFMGDLNPKCPHCDGRGYFQFDDGKSSTNLSSITCPLCHGTGIKREKGDFL